MDSIRVALVADPAAPTDMAYRLSDLEPTDGPDGWEVSVVSEPFTTGSEDVRTAFDRLQGHRQHHDDVIVGLTELPLHDHDGRHLLVQTDPGRRTAIVSLPALGGWRRRTRVRQVVRSAAQAMGPSQPAEEATVPLSATWGRWRLLIGMVLANRPWKLVPGLKSALVAALATGAVATINSTVWLLAGSLTWWRLGIATVISISLVVVWLVVDAGLWDRPEDDSHQARHRSRLYNVSTIATLVTGVLLCYVVLFVVNLLWALFVLDPDLVGGYLRTGYGYGDLVLLAWFIASAATVGGGLGSGLESDEAVRAAAYSKREEDRRSRVGH